MHTKQYEAALAANTDPVQRAVLRQLIAHIGPERYISGEELCRRLGKQPKKFERTLRLALDSLVRDHGIPVCFESGKGYHLAESIEDARKSAAELRSRASSMNTKALALVANAIDLFGGQEAMFFEAVKEKA